MENDEWEDCPDTDDSYVVLDVPGFSSEALLQTAKANGGVSLIGLDTPTPFLRVGSLHFTGVFDAAQGSDVIFATSAAAPTVSSTSRQKDLAPPRYGLASGKPGNLATALATPTIAGRGGADGASEEPPRTLTLMGHTEARVRFARVRLEPRAAAARADDGGGGDAAGQQDG
ncbi:hypothetical protein HDU82_001605 [Entophlyctis luteolus]|nr:hypothetical protein HDU82_001605 [Entophlyctis luteolus]